MITCDYAHIGASSGAIGLTSLAVLITALFTLNLVFHWNHPLVRSGQREWLLVMCCGALICELQFFVTDIGRPTRTGCVGSRLSLMIGSELLLGGLTVKLLRLHRLVLNGKLARKRRVSSGMMAVKLAGLIGVNMVIQGVGESRLSTSTHIEFVPYYTDQGDEVSNMVCWRDEKWPDYIPIGCTALVALYCCMLANQAKHLSSALSEGTLVFLAVYNATTVAAVVFLFGSVTSDAGVNALAQAMGILLACAGTVVLLMCKRFWLIFSLPRTTDWKRFITDTQRTSSGQTTAMAPTMMKTTSE